MNMNHVDSTTTELHSNNSPSTGQTSRSSQKFSFPNNTTSLTFQFILYQQQIQRLNSGKSFSLQIVTRTAPFVFHSNKTKVSLSHPHGINALPQFHKEGLSESLYESIVNGPYLPLSTFKSCRTNLHSFFDFFPNCHPTRHTRFSLLFHPFVS